MGETNQSISQWLLARCHTTASLPEVSPERDGGRRSMEGFLTASCATRWFAASEWGHRKWLTSTLEPNCP